MDKTSLKIIFINGRPCSGKDTQADSLLKEYPNAIKISTGDIVRGAKTPDGPYGKYYEKIKPHIEASDKGGLIPDDVMSEIVFEVINDSISEGKNTFIFTGFPRTTAQLNIVDGKVEELKEQYNVNVDYVCYAVLESHSIKRSEIRRERDLRTTGKIRKDDDPETLKNRLRVYKGDGNTNEMLHILAGKYGGEKRLHVIKSNGTPENIRDRTRHKLGLATLNLNPEAQNKSPRKEQ